MGSPARVLVVDDSPTILKVVSAILARHGFEPVTARFVEEDASGAAFDYDWEYTRRRRSCGQLRERALGCDLGGVGMRQCGS